ncbi:MAG: hypothetical protein AAF204_04940 [Pseudomonadota bacterium]
MSNDEKPKLELLTFAPLPEGVSITPAFSAPKPELIHHDEGCVERLDAWESIERDKAHLKRVSSVFARAQIDAKTALYECRSVLNPDKNKRRKNAIPQALREIFEFYGYSHEEENAPKMEFSDLRDDIKDIALKLQRFREEFFGSKPVPNYVTAAALICSHGLHRAFPYQKTKRLAKQAMQVFYKDAKDIEKQPSSVKAVFYTFLMHSLETEIEALKGGHHMDEIDGDDPHNQILPNVMDRYGPIMNNIPEETPFEKALHQTAGEFYGLQGKLNAPKAPVIELEPAS